MSNQIRTYKELKQQIHDDLRSQHPEWIEADGRCAECDEHEERLRKLLKRIPTNERTPASLSDTEIAIADRDLNSSD